MVDTVQADIEKAWGDHLATLVTSPVTKVAYPNVKFKQAGSKPYLELRFFPASTITNLVGSDAPKIYVGVIQITVMAKEGKGSGEALMIAGQIVDHFKMGVRVEYGSIASHVPRQPSILAGVQDKSQFMVPVQVPYFTSH